MSRLANNPMRQSVYDGGGNAATGCKANAHFGYKWWLSWTWCSGDWCAMLSSFMIVPQVMDEIVQRTASAMVAEGCPYRGVLFAGLMIKHGKVRGAGRG